MKDKTLKEEWAINKAQQHANIEADANVNKVESSVTVNSNNSSSGILSKSKPKVGWLGLHCSLLQLDNLKDYMLLDSDSTDMVFCNEDYMTGI